MVINDRVLADLLADVPAICLLVGPNKAYFGVGRALDVAAWFTKRGHILLGFDGLVCDGTTIAPLEACIADFSSATGTPEQRAAAGLEAASRILSEWSGTVEFVDFVFDR